MGEVIDCDAWGASAAYTRTYAWVCLLAIYIYIIYIYTYIYIYIYGRGDRLRRVGSERRIYTHVCMGMPIHR